MTDTAADVSAAPAEYPDLGGGTEPAVAAGLDRLHDVPMSVTIELGRTRMRVRDLLQVSEGSVVELDRTPDTPVDVLVNGTVIARGEVVVVGDELGVRITELCAAQAPA